MKRFISVFLSLAIILSCSCISGAVTFEAQTAECCVVNGGAENGIEGWTLSDQWATFAATGEPHTGEKSFTLPGSWKGAYQMIQLQAGKTYILTCYTKGTSRAAFILNGNIDGQKHIMMESENYDWTLVKIIYESTADQVAEVRFNSQSSDVSDRLVDDIVLETVETDTVLLKNGGAELDGIYWGGQIVINNDLDYVYEGVSSFKIPTEANYKTTQAVEVEPNTQYCVTWMEKGEANTTAILTVNNIWQQDLVRKESTDWVHRHHIYSTGENETVIEIGFKRCQADETQIYIDNIRLEKVNNSSFIINGDAELFGAYWSGNVTINDNPENIYEGDCSFIAPTTKYYAMSQTVAVEPNTKYTLSWYEKGDACTIGVHFNGIWNTGVNLTSSDEWRKRETVYKTGEDETTLELSFKRNAEETGNAYLDNICLEYSGAFITGFQGSTKEKYEGPFICDEQDNLITDSGFENGTGNWNTDSFICDGISVTEDAAAVQSGSKGLKFKTAGKDICGVFYVDVESYTNYYFTVYAKMPTWTKENTGDITFGVADAKSGNYIVFEDQTATINRMITVENQLNPASPDSEWHILGISFESNYTEKICIKICGANSEIYFDNMYLFEEKDAIPYVAPIENKIPAQILNEKPVALGCDESINLIKNGNLSNQTDTFWNSAYGFSNNNSIVDTGSDIYGNAILYENDAVHPDRTYYVKWIDVEPETIYTFSAKYCVLDAGNEAFFGILSGDRTNLVMPTTVKTYQLSGDGFDETLAWQTAGTVIDTKDADRIGIFIFNGGGKAYIDDVKLFPTYSDVVNRGLLSNGSFENGVAGWDMLDEQYEYVIDGSTANSGNYSVKVPVAAYGFMSQDVNVYPNTEYTLTLWTKGNEKSLEIAAYGGVDFAAPVFRVWNTDIHKDWTRLSYKFNSGNNNTMKIQFKICEGSAERVFDDVVLRRVGDTDDNGEVNIIDLIRFKKAIANGYADSDFFDLDFDGTVKAFDMVIMRKMLLGIKN